MSKIVWKPAALLAPAPAVIVSCQDGKKANLITVAWTGIVSSDPAMTYVSIRKERFSYEIIARQKEFAINLASEKMCRAVDLCGVKSGRNCDKFAVSGLTPLPCSKIGCPMIEQSPLALECKVTDVIPLGSHDMFLAEIVAVDVDSGLIDENGKLHLDKSGLLAFCHGEYFALGKRLGKLGFSVRRKPHHAASPK